MGKKFAQVQLSKLKTPTCETSDWMKNELQKSKLNTLTYKLESLSRMKNNRVWKLELNNSQIQNPKLNKKLRLLESKAPKTQTALAQALKQNSDQSYVSSSQIIKCRLRMPELRKSELKLRLNEIILTAY